MKGFYRDLLLILYGIFLCVIFQVFYLIYTFLGYMFFSSILGIGTVLICWDYWKDEFKKDKLGDKK